jgi:hypothetical protein
MLRGRKQQRGSLDGLLVDVRTGRGRALVVGDPGIGKTAAPGYAAETAPQFQVARAEGVESERGLPFAALRQLCGGMLDRLDGLPDPPGDALGVAFGLLCGGAPDSFLVGMAGLGLLSEVAADDPLLCLIDAAQRLDQASPHALACVACRLDDERVGLLVESGHAASTGRDELSPAWGCC